MCSGTGQFPLPMPSHPLRMALLNKWAKSRPVAYRRNPDQSHTEIVACELGKPLRSTVNYCTCFRNQHTHLPLHLYHGILWYHRFVHAFCRRSWRSFCILDPAHAFVVRSSEIRDPAMLFIMGSSGSLILREALPGIQRDHRSFPRVH